MKQKIRVGLFGCGGMAQAHVSRFQPLLDRIEVRAVVDVEIARARAVAELLPNQPLVLEDYRQALPEIDAALLVLPHHLHHPVGIHCLDEGKHVLCEKPLANSERECIEMIEAAQRNQRVLMVAYCLRFEPLVRQMRDLIVSETFGKCFQLSMWTEQHTERDPSDWMCRAATLGGGQLFSHGCHYIDLLLWIMGRPVRGCHFGSNLCTPWMEREGTSNVTIEFEGGKLGYHFGTWGARGSRLQYAFHAHCERGMLEWDLGAGTLRLYEGASDHVPGTLPTQHSRTLAEQPFFKATAEELSHFLDCVEQGKEPLTDAISSLEGLQVIWKLYEAEDRHAMADLTGLGLGSMAALRQPTTS